MRVAALPIAIILALAAAVYCLRPAPPTGVDLVDGLGIVHRQTWAAYKNSPTPVTIRQTILPAYADMRAYVIAFVPAEDAARARKDQALDYLDVMTDGWTLAADALDQESIVVEGQANEKFEEALALLRSMGEEVEEPARNMRAEIALFLAADARIQMTYIELAAGDRTDAELADAFETELLPPWVAARDRFLAAAVDPPAEYQRSVERLTEYTELLTQAFTLQVESLRESDAEKGMQARALIEQAKVIQATVMREGLTQ